MLLRHVQYDDKTLDKKLDDLRPCLPVKHQDFEVSASLRACLKRLMPFLGLFFKPSKFKGFRPHFYKVLYVSILDQKYELSRENFSLMLLLFNLPWFYSDNFGFGFRAEAFIKWNSKTATQWLKQNNLYFWKKKTHDAFSPRFNQRVMVILLAAQRFTVYLPNEIWECCFLHFHETYGPKGANPTIRINYD